MDIKAKIDFRCQIRNQHKILNKTCYTLNLLAFISIETYCYFKQ